MSTRSKVTTSEQYPRSQVLHEIAWLEAKMEEVREQMKRRPSKWRHLKDLQRQVDDRKRSLSENNENTGKAAK